MYTRVHGTPASFVPLSLSLFPSSSVHVCIYKVAQTLVIKRIEMNKEVLYHFAIMIINNEVLINKDQRIRTRPRDSVRREQLPLLHTRRDFGRSANNNNGYVILYKILLLLFDPR